MAVIYTWCIPTQSEHQYFPLKPRKSKKMVCLPRIHYEAYLRGSYGISYHMYALLQLGYRQDECGGIYSEKSYVAALVIMLLPTCLIS